MTPAQRIIEKVGSEQALAKLIGVDVSRVYRWTYPKERNGGTGGLIPAKHHQTILDKAKQAGIAIEPADFFEAA